MVRDFNYRSLRTAVEPFALRRLNTDYSRIDTINRPFAIQKLVMNISGQDVDQTLEHIGRVVRDADPRHPFEFEFLDAKLDQLYKDEHQLTRLIGMFAGICIFIACLGLFGLAAFATEQRTREIGTRKVLGATPLQIILLLSRRVLALVAVASVIASAIAYFAIDTWLAGFRLPCPDQGLHLCIRRRRHGGSRVPYHCLAIVQGRECRPGGSVAPRVARGIDYHPAHVSTRIFPAQLPAARAPPSDPGAAVLRSLRDHGQYSGRRGAPGDRAGVPSPGRSRCS